MADATATQSSPVAGQHDAPLARRAAAAAIDLAFPIAIFALIWLAGDLTDHLSADNPQGQSSVGGVLRWWVAPIGAIAWSIWSNGIREGRSGQSVGKRWLDLATVRRGDLTVLGARTGLIRWVVRLVPRLGDNVVRSRVVAGVPSPAYASATGHSGSLVTVVLRTIAIGYVFFLVAWPVVLVATNAFENGFDAFVRLFDDPEFTHAFRLSVIAAVAAVILNTVFGVGISLLIVRTEFPGKRLLNSLLDIPLSVSPVVVGLALVLVYGTRDGWFGPTLSDAGIQIIWALPGIILATAFVSLPLVIREVVPVLREIGTEQEQAARSLGASSWQAFWLVTLPAIKWGVIYGVVLTLARSLGEFGAVKVVSGNVSGQTRTATLVVEERYLNFDAEAAYAISFILASVSVISIIVVTIWRARDARLH